MLPECDGPSPTDRTNRRRAVRKVKLEIVPLRFGEIPWRHPPIPLHNSEKPAHTPVNHGAMLKKGRQIKDLTRV
jgi:hypothetical protein